MLRDQTSVDAVEMFDRASLRECESNEDMVRLVPDIKGARLGAWVLGPCWRLCLRYIGLGHAKQGCLPACLPACCFCSSLLLALVALLTYLLTTRILL